MTVPLSPSARRPPVQVPTHVLDFMRGVAAVYVVLNHVRGALFKGGARTLAEAGEPLGLYDYASLALLQFTGLGEEFAIFFFCVSGFAMAHSMARSASVPGFYLRRAIRIWPPYLVAIALAALVCWLYLRLTPGDPVSARCADRLCTVRGLAKMAAYVKVQTPITPQFWSLPYEVIFYLLCPVLLWRPRVIPAVFALSVLLYLYGGWAYGIDQNPAGSVWVNFAVNAAFWFLSGALAYHHLHRVPKLSPRLFAAVALAILLVIFAVKMWHGDKNMVSNAIMIGFTVLCLRNIPHRLSRLPALNWGYFSYSIYIFHYAFLALILLILREGAGITPGDIAHYWVWTLAVPPILLGCWGMYFIGEKQCNALLARLRETRGGRAGSEP